MSNEAIIDLVALFVAVLVGVGGFYFTIKQMREGNKAKRAEFIAEIISTLRKDEQIAQTYYQYFEYGSEWYDDGFHLSEREKRVDTLFSYLDYICYLYKNNCITIQEFGLFKYQIDRVCRNENTKVYFADLSSITEWGKAPFVFENLIEYSKQLDE